MLIPPGRRLTFAITALFLISVLGACSKKPDAGSEAEIMKAGLTALYTRNDPNAAADQFRKVLERNPNHYGATFQLAIAVDRAGKPNDARPLWEKVLKIADGYNDKETAARARARLGKADALSVALTQEDMMKTGVDLLYTQRDPNAAATQFREVLEKNPNHYGATFQLAMALDRADKPAEARPVWEKMLKMAEASDNKDTTKTVRERLAKPDIVSEDALMRAGLDALYTRNDPGAAAEQFRKVLERNPSHYGATYQLATALDSAGKRGEARPLWEKMLKMAENTDDKETVATVRARLQKRQ
jgi:cytochrome c-type biogenesis protein CcmH/NrfG